MPVGWHRGGILLPVPRPCHVSAVPQNEESSLVMLKRHMRQQRSIEDYGQTIKELAGRAQQLLSDGHPEW